MKIRVATAREWLATSTYVFAQINSKLRKDPVAIMLLLSPYLQNLTKIQTPKLLSLL